MRVVIPLVIIFFYHSNSAPFVRHHRHRTDPWSIHPVAGNSLDEALAHLGQTHSCRAAALRGGPGAREIYRPPLIIIGHDSARLRRFSERCRRRRRVGIRIGSKFLPLAYTASNVSALSRKKTTSSTRIIKTSLIKKKNKFGKELTFSRSTLTSVLFTGR